MFYSWPQAFTSWVVVVFLVFFYSPADGKKVILGSPHFHVFSYVLRVNLRVVYQSTYSKPIVFATQRWLAYPSVPVEAIARAVLTGGRGGGGR